MTTLSPELHAACAALPSPCFLIDLAALRHNAELLALVRARTGCRVLLALKAFALWHVFPLLRNYLDGTCASGPWEARLGRDFFGKSVHVCAPAYSNDDLLDLLETADHITFNSCSQLERFAPLVRRAPRTIACGLRVNPEHSEAPVEKYSPCCRYSRLGTTRRELRLDLLDSISGLHLHTLCEQNSDAFARTLNAFEMRFGDLISRMRWINFGGGHHITRSDYNLDLLCQLLCDFRTRYGIEELYIEPGEAVALNAGFLVASVLDIMRNEMDIAILDVSASAHMP
ncbi:MAG: carboxynorspermidine decarboxylase, partial [bacterium]|nr:carboxynorspermidine decarboxylase [bacterium]